MIRTIAAAALLAASAAAPAFAATIWDGPTITIDKASYATVIDEVTDSVHLTRYDVGPLRNALYSRERGGPTDTEWAFSGLRGNGSLELAQAATGGYIYERFGTALNQLVGEYIVGRIGILHILSLDIYIGIEFTRWDNGEDNPGGGFTYVRTTSPVPVPAAGLLMLGGLCALAAARRRG